jgi:cytochrome c biogenesis protein CcmG/thiol:disulfide interchange protein DsbE
MGEQESMTVGEKSGLHTDGQPGDREPGDREPSGRAPGDGQRGSGEPPPATPAPAAAAGDKGPGADEVPSRWTARFRSLSRGRRIAITASTGVLAVVAAIAAIGGTSGHPAKAPAQPPAPNFTLSALGHSGGGAGGHISLAGFAGHPLVINFFASWCEACQKETPLLARFYRAAHGSITLIGVDANDKAAAALKFTRAAGVSYPVAFDPYPMHTTISYGVDALPQTFFLNAQHRIVKVVRGAVTEQELKAGVAQITK